MKSSQQGVQRKIESLPWWEILVPGVVAVFIGFWLLLSPQAAATDIFRLLGFFFLIGGIASIAGVLRSRAQWGYKVFGGLLAIILGLVLISQPLGSAYLASAAVIWIIGVGAILIGIALIIQGVAYAGWGHTILGIVCLALGGLFILGAAIGALVGPAAFGAVCLVGGTLAIVEGARVRGRRRSQPM
jgi:uncharacterized membrane protein HdeD (DUF308 family)